MSEGMLGKLPLSEIRGPRDTLENLLAGKDGKTYLDALNKMLRGENPWPIVSKIEEDYTLTPEDYEGYDASKVHGFGFVEPEVWQILEFVEPDPEPRAEGVEVILLHFDWYTSDSRGTDLKLPHVLAEMKRLKLSRPTRRDAIAFSKRYPLVCGKPNVVFLHKPVRIVPDIGIGGMDIDPEPDGRHAEVLSIQHYSLDTQSLCSKNIRFLRASDVYAAIRTSK